MNKEEIFNLVANYLHEQFEVPVNKIRLQANLFDDLKLDSIDALDMVGMLEDRFDIEVDEDKLKSIRTIQDVVNTLARVLS